MTNRFKLVLLTAMLTLIWQPVGAQTPVATPQDGDYECDQIADYSAELEVLYEAANLDEIENLDPVTTTSSEFEEFAVTLFELADGVRAIEDVPFVAIRYHEVAGDTITLRAHIMQTVSQMGIFGVMGFDEEISQSAIETQAAWDYAYEHCGEIWSEEFPGGIDDGFLSDD